MINTPEQIEAHTLSALAEIKTIYKLATARLESLEPGQVIPVTTLAESIAEDFGPDWSGAKLYYVLSFLFKDYPGVEFKKGKGGGARLKTTPIK